MRNLKRTISAPAGTDPEIVDPAFHPDSHALAILAQRLEAGRVSTGLAIYTAAVIGAMMQAQQDHEMASQEVPDDRTPQEVFNAVAHHLQRRKAT